MTFERYITSLIDSFARCLSRDTIDLLKNNVDVYRRAFTIGDYEVYEQIGDVIIGHFIVLYSYKKFPSLNSKEGVKIVARVRINYTSCQFLAAIAEDLGFWDYILCKEEQPMQEARRLNLLEDVFEAFIGATNEIIDEKMGAGTGYIVCAAMLQTIYDKRDIKISYECLFDAKTRLKELCDFFKHRLSISWSCDKAPDLFTARLSISLDGQKIFLEATARTKIDAEQRAATEALERLRARGLSKDVPKIFKLI